MTTSCIKTLFPITHHILIIGILALISGCGPGSKTTDKSITNPLTPLFSDQVTPTAGNGSVKAAIKEYLSHVKASKFSKYKFTRKDLNGDNLKEAIIYMTAPYGHWCNDNGCTLLILKSHFDGFSFAGSIKDIRPPFYINKKTSFGWKDIGVVSSGDFNKKSQVHSLVFNGKTYKRIQIAPYMHRKEAIEFTIFP